MVRNMEAVSIIDSAQTVIQQVIDHPAEILAALTSRERANLVEAMENLSSRAAAISTRADLVELSDAICRLVENNPALRPLFFEARYDVESAQRRRKISLAEHEALTGVDQYSQTRAIQIKNAVLECREQLQKTLGEGDAQTKADHQDDHAHSTT
jgi:hypothetical protein